MSDSAEKVQHGGDGGAIGDGHHDDGKKPNVIFVLGAPGSGKGTQCEMIRKDLNFVHLSAGDLLRVERETPGSVNGAAILEHMKNGTIVPVEITCTLLENAMLKSGEKNFLVDGFPRNQDNLQGWIKQMGDKTNLLFVLFLEAPEELCTKRILSRAANASVVRPDDNVESMRKRFQTYINDTMPIIEYYHSKGLVRKVDSVRPPDVVHQEIVQLLKKTEGFQVA
ncbi:UMP-CMP kinase 2 [Hypsibius exemplaris]|uniref:UMP-CMP kinase n=1 Tax=Hypsibius exemplaris TaxID=2072580 RepID=A0A1W0WKK3_HYPEX|nr:UMP-CMP kinase 2 [Hypsibius exemplaris]